jgi:hypothetical protein
MIPISVLWFRVWLVSRGSWFPGFRTMSPRVTPRSCAHGIYGIGFTYNLNGNENARSFGYNGWHASGFMPFNENYDTAGRLSSIYAPWHDYTWPPYPVESIGYGPMGMTSYTLGTSVTGWQALNGTQSYDSRGRLSSIGVATVSTPTTVYSLGLTYAANSNVSAAADLVNGAVEQHHLRRAEPAGEGGRAFGVQWQLALLLLDV